MQLRTPLCKQLIAHTAKSTPTRTRFSTAACRCPHRSAAPLSSSAHSHAASLSPRSTARTAHSSLGASGPRTMATQAAPTAAPLKPFRTHEPKPDASPSTPLTHVFFHEPTSTWTYLVVCPTTREAAAIDSVLDYDPQSNTVSTETADGLLAFARQEGIQITRILETHAHADHLTGAAYLQKRLHQAAAGSSHHQVPIGAYSSVRETQAHFAKLYDVPMNELEGAFDELYDEGSALQIGECTGEVWHLPGHTECSAGYKFGDAVYTGDSVLLVSSCLRVSQLHGSCTDSRPTWQPSIGSARVDFPAGSATRLYASSRRLLSLPEHIRLFSGHHYAPSPTFEGGNRCSATVGEHKQLNKHFKEGTAAEEFVKLREDRDRELKEPRLLHQSLQVSRPFPRRSCRVRLTRRR